MLLRKAYKVSWILVLNHIRFGGGETAFLEYDVADRMEAMINLLRYFKSSMVFCYQYRSLFETVFPPIFLFEFFLIVIHIGRS